MRQSSSSGRVRHELLGNLPPIKGNGDLRCLFDLVCATCDCKTTVDRESTISDLTESTRGNSRQSPEILFSARLSGFFGLALFLKVDALGGTDREFFNDKLLVRIHVVIVMMRRTGLAPWALEFPSPGSLTSTS